MWHKALSHVRSEVTLNAYSGKRLVVDVASFKVKAWYPDVPQYYRSSEPQSHGHRATLSRLLSALSMATGATSNVVVCLDGGRFPPKSQEHLRRGTTATSRAGCFARAPCHLDIATFFKLPCGRRCNRSRSWLAPADMT